MNLPCKGELGKLPRSLQEILFRYHFECNTKLTLYFQGIVTQTYQAKIYVTLRSSVLDPAGTAVQTGLKQLGHNNIGSIRIGKYIELTLTADDESTASQQVDRMCDQLLANPVIENYRFDLQLMPTAVATGDPR
jgi:phosphoribosylformylglycinamidine synthase